MANDYIRREDAKIGLSKTFGRLNADIANYVIDKVEPADVVQVVHGRWIDADSHLGYFANCSTCGYQMDVHAERGYFNFCPNCGAKMDKI